VNQGKGAEVDGAPDKVVVLTALPLEYRAVRRLLEDPKRVDHPAGTIFESGRLSGTSCTVYLTATGPGNDSAASITERAVNFVQPRAVVFTGIAGALKADVAPGDVVVATEVQAYQGGKRDLEGFKARPQSWEATYSLLQVAQYVANIGDWKERLPERARTSTAVHFKPIAAGDIVLDAPEGSSSRTFLNQHYNSAVAVEMEGAGFASAAHKAQAVPHLMIRGISDRADGTKQSTDSVGMQEAAAQNAAVFLAEVIAQFSPGYGSLGLKTEAPDRPPVEELVWQPLNQPLDVSLHKDFFPASVHVSGPSILEIHLVPVSAAGRVSAVRMRQLATELVDLGRSSGFFNSVEHVYVHESAEVTAVTVDDQRGRSSGLAVTRSGQRSAWESLPKPGITYVLDEEHAQQRIAALLELLNAIEAPASPSYAPAARIEKTMLVTVERLGDVNPHSAGLRMDDAPIRVEPEEAVSAAAIATLGNEVAKELTVRLIYSFRDPRR
jgi:nucleoside phosphorylase